MYIHKYVYACACVCAHAPMICLLRQGRQKKNQMQLHQTEGVCTGKGTYLMEKRCRPSELSLSPKCGSEVHTLATEHLRWQRCTDSGRSVTALAGCDSADGHGRVAWLLGSVHSFPRGGPEGGRSATRRVAAFLGGICGVHRPPSRAALRSWPPCLRRPRRGGDPCPRSDAWMTGKEEAVQTYSHVLLGHNRHEMWAFAATWMD